MDNIGTPGTGIGTYFYLFLGLCMPLRELHKTINGLSSLSRWKIVMRQFLVALSVFTGAEVTFYLALEYFSISVPPTLVAMLFGHILLATAIFVLTPIWVSWGVVFSVLIAIRTWAAIGKLKKYILSAGTVFNKRWDC